MNNIQGTAIIRDRGQLTIPDKIREVLQWIKPNAVISISVSSQKEIVLKPFRAKTVDWDDIWRRIRRAQSFKGQRGNLSEFIIKDRENH